MNPLISIIVPIYNGEKFLNRVLETMKNQTVHNFELIFINDGSIDKTGEILDDYKNQYDWIQVIHQENKGVTIARNVGIRCANGTYIMFLDVDDYLENKTIEIVTDRIQRYSPDLIDFGMYYNDSIGNKNPEHHNLPKEKNLDRGIIESRIIPHMINVKSDIDAFIYDYAWNKVYKTDIIFKNNICFPENRRIWEDRVFVVAYLKYAQSYFSIDQYLYHYVSVENSLSRRYDLQFFDIILDNYSIYHQWFSEKYDFQSPYVYQYWSHSIENMIIRSLEQIENKDTIRSNINRILKNELVISWFAKRDLKSEHDKKVTELVLSGNVEALLTLYRKDIKKKRKTEKVNSFKYALYYLLKRN